MTFNSTQPNGAAPADAAPNNTVAAPSGAAPAGAPATPGGRPRNATRPKPKPAEIGTGVFLGLTNSSNALGYVGPVNYSVSVPPYVVKSCDQVILVPVKRISNFNDYCKKDEGFLTMSVYMVNLFETKDSNKLVESITLDKMTNIPVPLAGAPGCIDFRGGDKRIAACFEENDAVNQLIQAYQDFMRCRNGDNLKDLSWNEMRNILMSACMGQKTSFNTTAFLSAGGNFTLRANVDLKFPSMGNNPVAKNDINPYYSSLKVPGS